MRSERGFTLVEVLVAVSILTMTVTSAMLTFQTAMHSSERAAQVTRIMSVTGFARDHVNKAIRDAVESGRQDALSGQTYLNGVDVIWSAQVVRSAAPPDRFDPDAIEEVQYETRYLLYEVELELASTGALRVFSYEEVAWLQKLEIR